VINLGAGSDTWYWNLADEQKSPKRAWVEVDFGEITAKKLYQIKSRKQLLEKIQAPGWQTERNREKLATLLMFLNVNLRLILSTLPMLPSHVSSPCL